MPSWDDRPYSRWFDPDGVNAPDGPDEDPDAIEAPEPYSETEWASTEGAAADKVSRAFENVDPQPFIDGWHNRDPE